MTIEIGEAGFLSILGGVVIGGLRLETGDFVYRLIPVEHFQGEAFGDKAYLPEAVGLAAEIFSGLEVPRHTEPVNVCPGAVSGHVREWLRQEGYLVHAIPAAKELQLLLTTAWLQHLHWDIGFRGLDYETLTGKPGLAFWLCVQWLKGGNVNAGHTLPRRERFAKTGWSTYPLWSRYPYREAKELVMRQRESRETEPGGNGETA